jgi:hypothetical protein
MPRLAFEEPVGGPGNRRREAKRDNVVVVLKAAAFAIVLVLVGAVVLLVTASGEEPVVSGPAVPEIRTSHPPSSSAPTSTVPLAAIVVPEVRSVTTRVVPTVAPPPAETVVPSVSTAAPGPTGGDDRFVVVGEPCETRGEYAFTESHELVVCGGRKSRPPLVWRALFR